MTYNSVLSAAGMILLRKLFSDGRTDSVVRIFRNDPARQSRRTKGPSFHYRAAGSKGISLVH
jgi:hypothetical protein